MAALFTIGTLTIAVEGAAYHAAELRARPEAFSAELRAAFELGGFYQAVDYVQAQRLRRHLMAATNRALAGFDALVMPTAPVPATAIADSPPRHAMLRPRNTMPSTCSACRRSRSPAASPRTACRSACRSPATRSTRPAS